MAGVTLPKIMALAAVGSVALVGVMAEDHAEGPMAMHDHDDHDHDEMETELMALGYKGYMNIEYIPEDGLSPLAEDLEGAVADSAAECAAECEGMVGCNGASYYPDPTVLGLEQNCWLKTFTDSCMPPAASMENKDVILLLKPDADCAMAPTMAPTMAMPGAVAPVSDGVGTREFIGDDLVEDVTAGTVSVRSAAAALAVAGAMLALV